jgi:hypothetical protein
MKLRLSYNYTIATLLIVIYLALPATIFAYSATLELGLTSETTTYSMATTTMPCDESPCSNGHSSDCCDTTLCICECFAPLSQGLRLTYTPVIANQSFWETSWFLPRIYRPIFVPPQNRALNS